MVKVRIDLARDGAPPLPRAPAQQQHAPTRPAADEPPPTPEALKQRGDDAFRRGDTAAAARAWTEAAAAAGRSGPDARRLAVACLANASRAQLDRGRAADALRAATEAISLDPDHPRARYFRAWALLALGRLDDADAAIALLVAAEPRNPRVLDLKAEATRARGHAADGAAAARAGAEDSRAATEERGLRGDDAARAKRAEADAPPEPGDARPAPAAAAAAAREGYAPPTRRFNVDAPKRAPTVVRADPTAAEVARLRAARRPAPAPADAAPRSVHAILAEKRKARRAARAAPAPRSVAPTTAWTAMAAAEAANVATAMTRKPADAPPRVEFTSESGDYAIERTRLLEALQLDFYAGVAEARPQGPRAVRRRADGRGPAGGGGLEPLVHGRDREAGGRVPAKRRRQGRGRRDGAGQGQEGAAGGQRAAETWYRACPCGRLDSSGARGRAPGAARGVRAPQGRARRKAALTEQRAALARSP